LDDVEKVEQLPVDDWTDQDLLTKDEARERLVTEIGRTKARVGQLQVGNPDEEAEIALLSRRLNAMESIRDEYGTYLDGK
jgi:chorismate mutase